MGLRRTPPPGMDAPPPFQPVNFPTEYPESPAGPPLPSSPPPVVPVTPIAPIAPIAPITAKSLSPKLPSSEPPSPEISSLEAFSPTLPLQFTPRNPPPVDDTGDLTPRTGLVGLARAFNRPPATPQRPTTSAGGAASIRRSIRRTPGAGRLNPLSAKLTARSPHANRAFETRRVERRKSGRYPTARETPRDLLRALSRQLAPTTNPYEPTPNPTPVPARRTSSRRASDILFYSDPGHASDDDEDTDTLPPAPRLSMNPNEFDQSFDEDGMPEPRFSLPLDDFDDTLRSIEFARRAASEQPRSSLTPRTSDRFDFQPWDPSEAGDETVGEISMMVGEESMLGDLAGGDEEDDEHMVDEEGDVTTREEPELDGDDSMFLGRPNDSGSDGGDGEEGGEEEEMLLGTDHDIGVDRGNQDPEPSTRELALSRTASDFKIKPFKTKARALKRAKKVLPLSRHGHPVPHFPRATIKKMAQNFAAGASISNETLNALVAASEAFFEQVSDDLAVYAGHAGRKTIEDVDVVQLLKRQRQINPQNTVFSLARRHLPRELLQEVRMPVQKLERPRAKKRAGSALETVEEEGEEA